MAAAAAAASVLLAGCSLVSINPEDAGAADPGELKVLSLGPVATWDPQRMASAKDIAFAGRVFARTLTAYPAGGDAAAQRTLSPDLATDTGTPDRTLTRWSFTLRDDARWQDGSPVTCQDVKYGVARSFAEPFVTEGLNYPLAALALPRDAAGRTAYAGPYAGTGQADLDRAISCKGPTITFVLAAPRADFNHMVSLPAFAPFKQSEDRRGESPHAVFSSGPYQLEDKWRPSSGGTFVRNPHWSAESDPIRGAGPDSIRYVEGMESQTAAQQVMADAEGYRDAVTLDSAPPAMQQSIATSEGLAGRSLNPRTGFVDYLALNATSEALKPAAVRRALAMATNRSGYVSALGGPTAAEPAFSLLSPALPGHLGRDQFDTGPRGDAEAARALLEGSGATEPVPVRVAYRSTPTMDKALAALEAGWEAAGFEVTLKPVAESYFETISEPEAVGTADVFWANWAPAWPDASTVLPPLFDSRLNLTPAGPGRDYGHFRDAEVDQRMTALERLDDDAERARAWSELEASLVARVVHVPLAQHRAMYVAGSDVTGLAANEALGGHVDLARVGTR